MMVDNVSLLSPEVKHTFAARYLSSELMQTMGDRIRQLRKAKGLTQDELGYRVGVSRIAVQNLTNTGTI